MPGPDKFEFLTEGPPDCNWGELTADAIAAGFDQGGHSSEFAGEPRVGLANVDYALFDGERGDIFATCAFIESTLDGA